MQGELVLNFVMVHLLLVQSNDLQLPNSVQPPRDIFSIYIDGESAAQLVGGQEWTDVALGVSPGPHTINFSYQHSIFGVDPLPESPPERLGAVWIDNVAIEMLPAERTYDAAQVSVMSSRI